MSQMRNGDIHSNDNHHAGDRPDSVNSVDTPPGKVRDRQRRDLSKGWLGKTLAGVICGLAIALIASGFFMLPDTRHNTIYDKYQIAMWIVPPIWLAILSCCYLFRDAMRAWLWLGGISIAGLVLFKGLAA